MDYYCSAKFTELQVHIQSRLLYNCCYAKPERISVEWLEKNPGRLFHTATMLQDRKLMLENKSCESCYWGCYKYEEKGLQSHRKKQNKTYIDNIHSPIKQLGLSISNDCNLTCAYCGPEWSSAWSRDITKNKNYVIQGKEFYQNNMPLLWSKLKQKTRTYESKFFQLIIKEISLAKHLEGLAILGGEPLLHNNLFDILEHVNHIPKITLTTGLGISADRLTNILQKLKKLNLPIEFKVSGETTGPYYEFLRYGNKWNEFCDKVKMISDNGFNLHFQSVLTNITLLDFHNFYNKFAQDYEIKKDIVNDRPFFNTYVLDDESKKSFLSHCEQNKISKNIITEKPSNIEIKSLANFINEFSKRRKIDLSFLPKNFTEWYNQEFN